MSWKSWDVVAKRSWLQTTFGAADDTAAALRLTCRPRCRLRRWLRRWLRWSLSAPAENVSKAKKTKKSKGKDVAIAPISGEVMEADVLADLVHEIENTKEPQALKMISELMEQTEVATFRIAGLLSLVQANNWFKPYATFREFIEAKIGMGYRKALCLIEIYTALSNSGIPWVEVKDVGWTKLLALAPVLTPENVKEWVEISSQQNTVTLLETVKAAKAKAAQTALTDQSEAPKVVTTLTFKVHTDQKVNIDNALEKAKGVSGTEVATVALEYICLDYLGGATLAERMKKAGVENALKALEQAFPSMNFDVSLVDDEKAA